MSRSILLIVCTYLCICCVAQNKQVKGSPVKYYSGDDLLLEGTAIPATEKENRYDRLPASYQAKVRSEVWSLSKSSAGLSVHFLSNTTAIKVKWEVLNNFKMNHMPETGIKGIDLYYKSGDQWQYINTGKPTGKMNEATVVNNMLPEMREYKIFLPLYDGVVSLDIGIDSLSIFKKPAPALEKPIVFYGTSITQGGCASRPGMAYTNIISRRLNRDCINFGFSGNGRMELSIAELLAETPASFFVIDCVPNMNLDQVINNTMPLVEVIRAKQSSTPIVFVESTLFEKSFVDNGLKSEISKKNAALRVEYEKLKNKGVTNIFYIESKDALGHDHEATVDGVHFTDLGFMRFADFLLEKFRQFGLPGSGKQ